MNGLSALGHFLVQTHYPKKKEEESEQNINYRKARPLQGDESCQI